MNIDLFKLFREKPLYKVDSDLLLNTLSRLYPYENRSQLFVLSEMVRLGIFREMEKQPVLIADIKEAANKLSNKYGYATSVLEPVLLCIKDCIDKELAIKKKEEDLVNREKYFIMGQKFLSGTNDVPKDEAEAFSMFSKAAELGNEKAILMLGNLYMQGIGVKKDVNKALELYNKVSENPDPEAQFYLGLCYWRGDGIGKNIPKAMKCLKFAAQNGNSQAKEFLDKIKENDKSAEEKAKLLNSAKDSPDYSNLEFNQYSNYWGNRW